MKLSIVLFLSLNLLAIPFATANDMLDKLKEVQSSVEEAKGIAEALTGTATETEEKAEAATSEATETAEAATEDAAADLTEQAQKAITDAAKEKMIEKAAELIK
jgi:hypothetical protein